MKILILALTFVFTFSTLADEIPVPARVVMYNNPTLNGIPFAAVFAHDYQTNATVGGVNIEAMAANSALIICVLMGHERAYSYNLAKVATKKATVLFVDRNLVVNPVETSWIDEVGEFATTVFSQIGCYKKP